MLKQQSLEMVNQPQSPVMVYQPQSPVMVYQPQSPVMENQPQSPVMFTRVIMNQPLSPAMLDPNQQQTPEIVNPPQTREMQIAIETLRKQLNKLFAVGIVSSIFGVFICGIPGAYIAAKARKACKEADYPKALHLGKRAYYLVMFALSPLIVAFIPIIIIGGLAWACCHRCCCTSKVGETRETVGYTTYITEYYDTATADRQATKIEEGACFAAAMIATMGLSYWCKVPDPKCPDPGIC